MSPTYAELVRAGDAERAAVAAAGGVSAAVRAMKRFPADTRLQVGDTSSSG